MILPLFPPVAPAERSHTCHARDCDVPVKPELLMCFAHWRLVPRAARALGVDVEILRAARHAPKLAIDSIRPERTVDPDELPLPEPRNRYERHVAKALARRRS